MFMSNGSCGMYQRIGDALICGMTTRIHSHLDVKQTIFRVGCLTEPLKPLKIISFFEEFLDQDLDGDGGYAYSRLSSPP